MKITEQGQKKNVRYSLEWFRSRQDKFGDFGPIARQLIDRTLVLVRDGKVEDETYIDKDGFLVIKYHIVTGGEKAFSIETTKYTSYDKSFPHWNTVQVRPLADDSVSLRFSVSTDSKVLIGGKESYSIILEKKEPGDSGIPQSLKLELSRCEDPNNTGLAMFAREVDGMNISAVTNNGDITARGSSPVYMYGLLDMIV